MNSIFKQNHNVLFVQTLLMQTPYFCHLEKGAAFARQL